MKSNTTDSLAITLHRAKLGKKLWVDFLIPADRPKGESSSMLVEWDPAIPSPMPRVVKKRYLAERRKFYIKAARLCGEPALSIDTNGLEVFYPDGTSEVVSL